MTKPESSVVALFKEVGQPFEFRVSPIPEIRSGEMLVKVEACTVCGSDLHTYSGRRATPTPVILGHEILGRLVLPERVVDGNGAFIRSGERLVWSVAGSCNQCFFCHAGLPQKCDSVFKYGHEHFLPGWPLNGGLSEYCTVRPGTFFMRAPDDISPEILTPASCATATVAAAIHAAGPVRGKKVLVMGAGMLGATACAMLDSLGATVTVCDVRPPRAQLAGRFGASNMLDATLPVADFLAEVQSLTDGRGADITLELAGHNSSVSLALAASRIGGVCVLAGSVFPQEALSVFCEDIVRRLLTIRGVHNYAPLHLIQALDFLAHDAKRYPFHDLIEAAFSLRDADKGFKYASRTAPYRIMIRPDGSSS